MGIYLDLVITKLIFSEKCQSLYKYYVHILLTIMVREYWFKSYIWETYHWHLTIDISYQSINIDSNQL